jgi:hypothetical protein
VVRFAELEIACETFQHFKRRMIKLKAVRWEDYLESIGIRVYLVLGREESHKVVGRGDY